MSLSLSGTLSPDDIAFGEPDRHQRFLALFRSRHGSLPHPEYLGAIAHVSRFLADECLRRPEWIASVSDVQRCYSVAEYLDRLLHFAAEPKQPTPLDLALFRRRELVRIVVRDALGLAPLADVTTEISNLADAILEFALGAVLRDLGSRYGVPRSGGAPVAFSVLALGKLGGRELNYSSDIDLMFLYGSNGETSGPQVISNREFFKKVANQLTTLLSTYTPAGACYRIDLRLRPDGSLGEVCLSLDGAQEYYRRRARDWELQMLIKARCAAGDRTIACELLTAIDPLIYSSTLDFNTIETMSATRERISEKAARKRLRKDQIDVKLAPGGIRDIEFLVQCLQRLHGGRDESVRQGGTLYALSSLLQHDLLSASEHARLSGAYTFLRHVEHRLQLDDDQQTHALPLDAHDLQRVMERMPREYGLRTGGIGNGNALLQVLQQHLDNVRVIYERIVHAQRPLTASFSPSLEALPTLKPQVNPAAAAAVPVHPPLGTTEFAERVRRRLTPDNEHFVNEAVAAINSDPEVLAIVERNTTVANQVLRILELSPYLTTQITKSPELIREIQDLAERPAGRPAFEGLAAPLNDIDGLRRFYRREMFRIVAGSFCWPEPVFQTLDRTSGLAEFLIARTYRIALEQSLSYAHAHATPTEPFADPQQQLMVVALGRLGMREFDLSSDADVLFILPDTESHHQRFWTRVAERMIEIVSAYTGEAPILSLDTRLRPNGREGLLVQTESSYVEYFSKYAEAWEGIAYMKARAVAGDVERATNFLTQLQQVDWRRYGQGGRSRQDLRQMRLKLQREQGPLTPLKAGEGGYYDADFILMYLRLKGAGLFFKSLNTPERIDVVEKMGHLERGDAEFLLQATAFFRAVDHALRIVHGKAEEKLPASLAEREMVAQLATVWTHRRVNGESLEGELTGLRHHMRELFDRIFQ